MAHNIDMTGDRANIAFLGSRNDIWHRLGQAMPAGEGIDSWRTAAGLNWEAVKVPAIASLEGPGFDHLPPAQRFAAVPGEVFIVRSDNGAALGRATDQWQAVQPRDVLDWFQRYISVDDRFQLDVAGSLKGGKIIWATATYNGGVEVAGDKHVARVLMSTSFDSTQATRNQMTMTRVVCNNTLRMAHADNNALVVTRHNTKFDAAKVGRELGQLAQSVDRYKAIGEAMASNEMAKSDVSNFFKACLEIPFDAKEADVSTRKLNQFRDLGDAYKSTVLEGTQAGTAWTALNAVTRYVDHDRSTRGGASEDEARVLSSTFGSGDQLKGKAMGLLMPRIADRVPVAA